VRLDHERKVAQLALIGPETLGKIISEQDKDSIGYSYPYKCDYCPKFYRHQQTSWSPEYAAYQIEG